MTGRRTLDKALAEPTIKRIIERGPWANYNKCWECGAEAGDCCVGDDGKEALEVCDGRRLVIDDSAARLDEDRTRARSAARATRRDAEPSQTRDMVYRRRTGRVGEPQYAPCQCCGDLTRLWGRAVEEERTWCSKAECRADHKRVRKNAQRARQRERKAKNAVPCWWCGAAVQVHGEQAIAKRPCCGSVECARKINSANKRDLRAASQRADPLAAE